MHELVIPAVENKEEPALRDQGVICLGLIGLIDLVSYLMQAKGLSLHISDHCVWVIIALCKPRQQGG
jgi:hypothetical protein